MSLVRTKHVFIALIAATLGSWSSCLAIAHYKDQINDIAVVSSFFLPPVAILAISLPILVPIIVFVICASIALVLTVAFQSPESRESIEPGSRPQ